jgi:hypothetical protein
MRKLFATTRGKVIGILLIVLSLIFIYAWAERLAYCNADSAEHQIRALHGWTLPSVPTCRNKAAGEAG